MTQHTLNKTFVTCYFEKRQWCGTKDFFISYFTRTYHEMSLPEFATGYRTQK